MLVSYACLCCACLHCAHYVCVCVCLPMLHPRLRRFIDFSSQQSTERKKERKKKKETNKETFMGQMRTLKKKRAKREGDKKRQGHERGDNQRQKPGEQKVN